MSHVRAFPATSSNQADAFVLSYYEHGGVTEIGYPFLEKPVDTYKTLTPRFNSDKIGAVKILAGHVGNKPQRYEPSHQKRLCWKHFHVNVISELSSRLVESMM